VPNDGYLRGFDIVCVAIAADCLDNARKNLDLGRALVFEARDAGAAADTEAVVVEDGVPGVEGVLCKRVLFRLVAGGPISL
jgi:hypothetical protein